MRAACSLLLTFLAFAALAADEEAPQTGTIEVEVVYKDTGELVDGVYVKVVPASMPHESPERYSWDESERVSSDGRRFVHGLGFDNYAVRVRNPSYTSCLEHHVGSRFLYSIDQTMKEIVLTAEEPVVTVRFEVERGWRLTGVVRRQDGSPLEGALVSLQQGRDECAFGEYGDFDNAFALADEQGKFGMLGVIPHTSGELSVLARHDSGRGHRLITLYGQLTTVESDGSHLDIELETITVQVVVEVRRALWPFGYSIFGFEPLVGVWLERTRQEMSSLPDIELDYEQLGSCTRRRVGLLPTDRYEFVVRDLPATRTLRFAPGRRYPGLFGPPDYHFESPLSVDTATLAGPVCLRVDDPGARASRAFLYGVPSVIALVVCVTILIRHARRRRRLTRG